MSEKKVNVIARKTIFGPQYDWETVQDKEEMFFKGRISERRGSTIVDDDNIYFDVETITGDAWNGFERYEDKGFVVIKAKTLSTKIITKINEILSIVTDHRIDHKFINGDTAGLWLTWPEMQKIEGPIVELSKIFNQKI